MITLKIILGVPFILYSLLIILFVGPSTIFDWLAFIIVFIAGISILAYPTKTIKINFSIGDTNINIGEKDSD